MDRPLAVFLQIDWVRGFRYLDDAGKVMNAFDSLFPDKEVGPEGMRLKGPTTLREMTVSSTKMWLHFAFPDTLTQATDNAARHFETVAEILDVQNAKRFGFRTEWLEAGETRSAVATSVSDFALSEELRSIAPAPLAASAEIRWEVEDDFNLTVRLGTAARPEGGDERVPSFSTLFDYDAYSESTDGKLTIGGFRKFARKAERRISEHHVLLLQRFVGGVTDD